MNFISQLNNVLSAVQLHLADGLLMVAFIWAVQILNFTLGNSLVALGIRPRQITGLPGIVLSPWIHGSFDHIFFNSAPLFVLFIFMQTLGVWTCLCGTVTIVIVSGSLLWLFGRSAIHVGASGLIMGYLGFIICETYFHQSPGSLVVGAVAIYYFGSALTSIIPSQSNISFEGHFFGLIAGGFASYAGCVQPFQLISEFLYPLL